ncbi:MAG: GNAT family N-acetyltransferase [Chloroflexi bacterium]|nr:GNAT family N-acetyltransferase [Chloroflexota bacterium]MCI0855791.1 GNAT family N-acetyltransferase [Chloroflexota bacterium]MCI0889621.1 GNAT family N-acetyltransferase [Chloroflexota bacterium]
MSAYFARNYEGSSDLDSLIHFAQVLTGAHLPDKHYYHAGNFVWQLYAFKASDNVRLWWRDSGDAEIIACGLFEPPLTFQFVLHPDLLHQKDLAAEVIRWADQRRATVANKRDIPLAYQRLGSDTLSTEANDTDSARIALLTEHGYTQHLDAGIHFSRILDDSLPDVVLPQGARFRPIPDGDADARAELHRDAWSVWGESKHTNELYRLLRGAPLYDPDLDIVLEFEGQLVSYCICWLDTVNRVGLFEPVGTRPALARRGFGRAVIREGLRRLRDKGMIRAFVGTASINKPAAALYASAGFDFIERSHSYVKHDLATKNHE